MKVNKHLILTISFIFLGSVLFAQQAKEHSGADQFQWNLKDMYPSENVFQKDKIDFENNFKEVSKFKEKLNVSAENLFKTLERKFTLEKDLLKIYLFVMLKYFEDVTDSKYMELSDEMTQLYTKFIAETSFIEPEVLKIDTEKIREFIKEEPRLSDYEFYLNDIIRKKAHTGTAIEEKIISEALVLQPIAYSVFQTFKESEFPNALLELSDTSSVILTEPNFNLYRESNDREVRKEVFETYFTNLNSFQNTFGALLSGNINSNLFFAKAHNYESSLQSSVDQFNIPVSIYHNLIENVNISLPTFHRYLKLKKRIMGVDELHYYDLYAPIVNDLDKDFSYEEAKKLVAASLEPLGEEYVDIIRKAFNESWIDVYPNKRKRSGAFCMGGAYDTHPYIMLNYNKKYNDIRALTHELGHAAHFYYSKKHQPYPLFQFSIFVAEIASTCNEALLNEYLLTHVNNDTVRLFILGNILENARQTFFRQTQFAEFELAINAAIEQGDALSGEKLNKIYKEIADKYYGHNEGICIVDDYIKSEWMNVPHFYYNYYVYQYATSFTASMAFAEKILSGNIKVKQNYLDFLSAGGSKYPLDLLSDAGIDMTSSEPFNLTIERLNAIMDEMEAILLQMEKSLP